MSEARSYLGDGSRRAQVGLVGAGPWASMVHAPLFAAGPETALAGVWARRHEAAVELATAYGAAAYPTFEALLDACEIVAFCVPPDVQARLAPLAAAAGKDLLLEKPIAGDLRSAEHVAASVAGAGVRSMVAFSWHYAAPVRQFLADLKSKQPDRGVVRIVSGALLGGPFATPWRLERGALLDLGPHAIEFLDAALGEIVEVRAQGDRHGSLDLFFDHASGASSEVALTGHADGPAVAQAVISGTWGECALDVSSAVGVEAFETMRRELVAPGPHPLDVHRGVRVQRVITAAEHALH